MYYDKFNTRLATVLIICMILASCAKEIPVSEDGNPEALTEEEVELLDNMPEAIGFDSSTIILPNGEIFEDFLYELDSISNNNAEIRNNNDIYKNLGPQDARNLLIKQLCKQALYLTKRKLHQFPDDGIGKPNQNGLSYSWGSKNHKVRQKPPGPGTKCINESVYGLDCSGFIYQLFIQNAIPFIIGPANSQRKASVLQNAIESSISELKKIRIEELGQIPVSSFETGDIIYWLNSNNIATHIGIILKSSSGNISVLQSNGSIGRDNIDCQKNRSLTRGPRRIATTNPYWFGDSKKWGITRINADISGEWSLSLRCEGESIDAITLNLTFPTSSSNTFSISGTGVDYDGDPLNCTGNINFNNITNTLGGTIKITSLTKPDFYRHDSFTVKLDKDETNYFPLTLGSNNDAGCSVEGRLKNKE